MAASAVRRFRLQRTRLLAASVGAGGVWAVDRDAERDFELFVASSAVALMRLAFGLTGDRAAAEDLLQTTLTKAFVSWRRVVAAEDPGAYARRVLVNTHTSSWRRRRVREHLTSCLPDVPDLSAPAAGLDELALMSALDQLGRRQRAVVLLRYLEDWPDEDIARALGCTTGTVRSQALRALTTLRNLPELEHHRPHRTTTPLQGR